MDRLAFPGKRFSREFRTAAREIRPLPSRRCPDVEDTYNWYEQQRDGLGREFLAEVRCSVLALQRRPERAAILHRDTRRLLVSRFPYALYYRIFDDRIVVVACLHGRRAPQVWKARR